MTSRYTALNRNIERLKISVQMRKQQRKNWMQRLMKDTTPPSVDAAQDGNDTGDRAVNSELELMSADTADANPTSVALSREMDQGRTSAGMLDAASKQASVNNTTALH